MKKIIKFLSLTLLIAVFLTIATACDSLGGGSPGNSGNTPGNSGDKNPNAHKHVYELTLATELNKATDATCTEKATYYYVCSCGEKGTETFESGEPKGHSFTNYVSDNNATYTEDGTKSALCNNGCGVKDTITDEGSMLIQSTLTFRTLSVNGTNVSGIVSNTITQFDFNNEISTTGNMTYVVSLDENGLNASLTNRVSLAEGDNVVYVFERVNNKTEKIYTVTIRRKQMYTITFNTEGGTAVQSQQVEEGSLATVPTVEPEREGYTFNGWNFSFATVITEEKTINALWNINEYTLTIVYGNGQENKVVTQDFGTEIEPVVEPTKVGYNFVGWSEDIPETMPAENKTITAQWSVNNYVITLVLDNGQSDRLISQDYGTAINPVNDPVKEGYTFAGWSEPIPETMPAESKTITAQWTVNEYVLTLKLENGQPDVVITQNFGTEIENVSIPTKDGYAFAGWSEDIPETMPAENKTITASWSINQYTLTIIFGNGAPNGIITEDFGVEIDAINDPVKEGHTFAGWSEDIPETMPAENKTITAQWTVNEYVLTLKLENGQPDVVITQNFGTEIENVSNPTKVGYTFVGWSEPIPETMPAENKIITAQWALQPYTLTLVLNNDNPNVEIIKNVGDAIGNINDPVKEGHTFAGWSEDIPETMPAENKIITAQWTVNQYTLTIKYGNGQPDKTITQDYGTVIYISYPERNGYFFAGWSDPVPKTMPAENSVITATWQTIEDAITSTTATIKTTLDTRISKEVGAVKQKAIEFDLIRSDLKSAKNLAWFDTHAPLVSESTHPASNYYTLNYSGPSVQFALDAFAVDFDSNMQFMLTNTVDYTKGFSGKGGFEYNANGIIRAFSNPTPATNGANRRIYALTEIVDGELQWNADSPYFSYANTHPAGPYYYGDISEVKNFLNPGYSYKVELFKGKINSDGTITYGNTVCQDGPARENYSIAVFKKALGTDEWQLSFGWYCGREVYTGPFAGIEILSGMNIDESSVDVSLRGTYRPEKYNTVTMEIDNLAIYGNRNRESVTTFDGVSNSDFYLNDEEGVTPYLGSYSGSLGQVFGWPNGGSWDLNEFTVNGIDFTLANTAPAYMATYATCHLNIKYDASTTVRGYYVITNQSVTVEDHVDGVKVTVTDDAWRSAKFEVALLEGLDLTSYTGIVVKYKVLSNQYTAPKFGLIRGGLNYNLANHSMVVEDTEEWQYLYLFNSSLDALYDAVEKRMDFMFYEGGSTTGTVRTVEFVIGEIKYFVKLATPANIAVSAQGVVTWDAVDGADGYEVDVNGTVIPVTTNTYTLTDLSQVATIKVCATSNDAGSYLTSDNAVTAFDPNPDPNMLVDFATEADLSKLSADGKFTPDSGTAGFGTAPTMMDAKVTDAENGADMKLWCRNYYSGGHQFVYDVYVNVGELDADRNIKVRFQVYDLSDRNRMDSENVYFMMISVNSKANYKNPTTLTNVPYQEIQKSDLWTLSGNKLEVTDQATWFELTITSAQLQALGYQDGDTTIGFAVLRTGSGHGDYSGYGAYLRIDYIKYVDAPPAPAITEPADTLASFKNSAYAGIISKVGENNTLQSATYLPTNANDGFGGHDGAVQVTLTKTGYGFIQGFQVALSKAIDVTTNTNGIKVRLRVVSAPVADGTTELKVKLGELKQTDAREYSIREYAPEYGTATIGGDWVEITIPASALTTATNGFSEETPYNGTSVIAFAFCQASNSLRNTSNSTPTVIQIDYIKYA